MPGSLKAGCVMAIDSVRYVGAPSEYVANAVSQSPLWRSFGERIGVMSRVMCPVGKIPAGQDAGKPHANTHLRDTMEVRFVSGDTPMIVTFLSFPNFLRYFKFASASKSCIVI